MTHDDILALLERMIENQGSIKLAALGDADLAQEMLRQGLARRDGAVLTLTGNGWHTGKQWWPKWLPERIAALTAALVNSHGTVLKMSTISIAAQLDDRSVLTRVAWEVLAHACMGCFEYVSWGEIDGKPDGTLRLHQRGYIQANYDNMIAAKPWTLLPIDGSAPEMPGAEGEGR